MKIRMRPWVAILAATILMAAPTGLLAQRAKWLPKIGPDACTSTYCVFYRAPYATKDVTITVKSLAGHGRVALVTFLLQDKTAVSFAGITSDLACTSSSRSAWKETSRGEYRAVFCAPANGKYSSVRVYAAAVARKPPFLSAARAAEEAETCVWAVSYGKEVKIEMGEIFCLPQI